VRPGEDGAAHRCPQRPEVALVKVEEGAVGGGELLPEGELLVRLHRGAVDLRPHVEPPALPPVEEDADRALRDDPQSFLLLLPAAVSERVGRSLSRGGEGLGGGRRLYI